MIRSVPGVTLISLALAIAGCERGTPTGGNETNSAAEANAVLEAAEENAAALAQDDELANQAAADEAADMAVFGGNAAAGEGANSPPELPTDGHTTP
jgi:hypothetical protein